MMIITVTTTTWWWWWWWYSRWECFTFLCRYEHNAYVTSMVGHPRRCDMYCHAISLEFIGPEPALGLSMMSTKRIIWKWSIHEQNKRRHNIQRCRQAKHLMLGVMTLKVCYQVTSKRCKKSRILIGLLTGHDALNQHLTLLKRQSDASCHLCEEEQETSLHFLGRCSATMARRTKYFERPFLGPCELRQE